ncbi:hypothetical protein [Virgibacillus ndiopensis]|nr:hypothetical protein [Virgibacillus ndiopensis]
MKKLFSQLSNEQDGLENGIIKEGYARCVILLGIRLDQIKM